MIFKSHPSPSPQLIAVNLYYTKQMLLQRVMSLSLFTDDILSSGRFTFEYGPTDVSQAGTLAYNLSSVIRDDNEIEPNEGFILYLEIDEDNNPSDNFDFQAGSGAILVIINDNDGESKPS